MSDDDIDLDPDDLIIPDRPQTVLAFRTWRLSDDNATLLSINAPSLTGKAGGNPNKPHRISWIHRALADPEGQSGWLPKQPLVAQCGRGGIPFPIEQDGNEHGPIPAKRCSCGIYATTKIEVINQYLGNEVIDNSIAIRGPVLGVVEMGGRVIPATQGYRAAEVRIAAILLISDVFTKPHSQLKRLAERYGVPALVPHSLNPEDYREYLAPESSLADETEAYLKKLLEEGGE
jgi:hypothetical protein